VPGPAARVDGGLHLLGPVLVGQDVLAEPGDQVVGVLHGRLAEPQRLPDLGTMELDGPPGPLVLRVELGWRVELLRDVDDGRGRDIALMLREAPLDLEILEQERAAEARRGRLVPITRSLRLSHLVAKYRGDGQRRPILSALEAPKSSR